MNDAREQLANRLLPIRNALREFDLEADPATEWGRKLLLSRDCCALDTEAGTIRKALESCGVDLVDTDRSLEEKEEAWGEARESKAAEEEEAAAEAERRPPDRGLQQQLRPASGPGARKERAAADARPTLDRGKVAERRAAAQQPELFATATAEENVRLVSERPLWGSASLNIETRSYSGVAGLIRWGGK